MQYWPEEQSRVDQSNGHRLIFPESGIEKTPKSASQSATFVSLFYGPGKGAEAVACSPRLAEHRYTQQGENGDQ